MSSTMDINKENAGALREGADPKKRRFLIAATTAVSAVGAGAIAVPFLTSMAPSERAKAAGAPVEADISKLEEGQVLNVEWRGKPVWLLRRSEQMLADLPAQDGGMKDPNSEVTSQQPEYAKNAHRSIKPEYLVVVGICTHLGCSPTYRPEIGPADLGANWKGGWYCPCHGSRFDLAGRVVKNSPAGTNLEVPPHKYLSDTLVLIGEDGEAA